MPITSNKLQFLSGGGQMSERIRAFDWATTPLGPPANWSQSLKTSINLMLNSQQPVWIGWGEENTFLYNDPYIEVLGLAKHEWALGQPAQVVWAEIWDFCGPLSDKVYQKGESSFINDTQLFMNRGTRLEEVYYSFSYSPIYDETGKVGGLFCPNIDTTAKMLNERRLHTLSELASKALIEKTIQAACASAFATMAENREDIPFALLYLLEPEGRHVSLEQVAGLMQEETNQPVIIELSDWAPERSPWPLAQVLYSYKSQVVSLASVKGLPLGLADQPVSEAVVLPVASSTQTRPLGVLVVGVNPTRELDAEYSTFYDLIASQVATAIQNARSSEEDRKRNEALAELDRAKTVFFSNISHEFRTPLTLMLGSLEELLRKDDGHFLSADRSALEATNRNAMRLLRLVNALLDFSRIESGRAKAEFQRVNLAQYTADLASNFRSIMQKGGLEFQVICTPFEASAYIDKEMWEKIVLNLLSNAFKYTLNGKVILHLFAENDQVILTVQDTGVGIPAAELPHMFERFHRVQNVVGRSFEGTGIGLSLVHELVNIHGGNISVSSEEGEGTTFTVSIPLGKKHLPPDQVKEKESEYTSLAKAFLEESLSMLDQQEMEEEISGHNSTTVLVVDDNSDMRAHIKTLLGRYYHVITANNGAEALEVIAKKLPNLVLSDIMMPVMDGLELLKSIKENPRTTQLPVVLLSARAGEEARIEGLNVGADDYLVKPFSAKELLARVRSQIRIVRTRAHVEQQLRNLFVQAPIAICILRGPEHVVEVANEQILEIWGKTADQVLNKPILEALPEIAGQGFQQLLDGVYNIGERFVTSEAPIKLVRNGQLQKLWIKFVYEALREENGSISGVMVLADEITALVEARRFAQSLADARTYAYEQIQNLFLQAPTAIQILRGPDFVIELANNRLLELWGRQQEEVLNRPLFEIIPEVETQGYKELLTRVYETGERFIAEEIPLNFLKDGKLVKSYAKLVYEPLREPNGDISGIMVLGDDITPQVVARQKIEENEQRLNNIIAQVNAGIVQVDPTGNFIEANERYCEIVGRSKAELLQLNIMDITHPDDVAKNLVLFRKCVEEGLNFNIEKRYFRPDGSIVWVNNAVSRVTNAKGEYFLTAVTIDISADVEARRNLEISEVRFRTLAETLPQLVWITDGQGTQEYASSRWEEYTGIPPTGPDSWNKIIHPDDMAAIAENWQMSMENGHPYKVEVRLRSKQDDYRWHFVHGEPIFDASGKIIKWIGAFTDIHDQKTISEKLEQQVAERTAALFQSNESLEANNRQLLRAIQELESFNYVASHDLQEPLRKIQTFANFLKVKRHDAEAVSLYLDKISAASQRMSDLVQALLQYSRLENTTQFEPTDLNQVLQDTLTDFELSIKDTSATIHSPVLPTIAAVPLQMHQLFTNLLGNALKFTKGKPVITIDYQILPDEEVPVDVQMTGKGGKDYIEIKFSDNGIGFDPQYAEQIFQLFKRLHSRDEFSGTGIGLSICKKIVDNHGGSIRAVSELDRGATFVICLPVEHS